MIKLNQDSDGYIRMNQHFAEDAQVMVHFWNGKRRSFSGRKLNAIYDLQLAVYQSETRLDTNGIKRGPTNRPRPKNNIMFVFLRPSMASRDYHLAA